MRRLFVVVVALVITGLVAAPAALADKPEISREEFTPPDGLLTDCGDFEVWVHEDWDLTTKTFFKQGELDRVHFHLDIDGFVYNMQEPGKSLDSIAHYSFVTYAEELFEVWTQHGLFYRIELPQGGHVLIDAGHFVVQLVDGLPVILWQAGPHPLEFVEGDFDAVCEALS